MNNFLNSSLGRKVVMAATGLFICVFLIEHLYGNVLLYAGDGGEAFNEYSHDIIACAITSSRGVTFSIPIKREDWKDGMYSESYIKAGNILTIDKTLVIKRIGRLNTERFNQVMAKINELVG